MIEPVFAKPPAVIGRRWVPNSVFCRGPAAASSRVIKDRTSLSPGVFCHLPLGSAQPRGWLRDQLTIQANEFCGHLNETWMERRPKSGWLGGTGESWERGPYFLDGLLVLTYMRR